MSGYRDRIHLTDAEIRASLREISGEGPPTGRDPRTSLAWRPAWAIRSRRGALRPFVEMIRDILGRR